MFGKTRIARASRASVRAASWDARSCCRRLRLLVDLAAGWRGPPLRAWRRRGRRQGLGAAESVVPRRMLPPCRVEQRAAPAMQRGSGRNGTFPALASGGHGRRAPDRDPAARHTTCGLTSPYAVYQCFQDPISLEQVIDENRRTRRAGCFAIHLGLHAPGAATTPASGLQPMMWDWTRFREKTDLLAKVRAATRRRADRTRSWRRPRLFEEFVGRALPLAGAHLTLVSGSGAGFRSCAA
jgi:hypothetical protein